jgi:hypothetical protein
MPGFILVACFQFVGQQATGEESVQGLGTLFRATNPNPSRSMP